MRDRGSPAGVLFPIGVLALSTVLASAGVATVLPEIGRELSLPTSGSSWILSAYQLAFAIATALSGPLADRRGVSGAFRLGTALFGAGALLAGIAWTYPVLVLGRFVEGLGGGALLVLSQVLLTSQRDDEVRRKVLSGFAAVATAASAAGPLMGGAVGETLGWRALTILPAVSVLAGLALGAGGRSPAPSERRRPASPRLVRNRAFLTACVVGAAVFGAYFGLLFAVPVLLSRGWGWTPLEIGLSLLPASLLGIAGSWAGGRAKRRRIPRAAMVIACAAGCLGAVTAAATTRPWTLILAIGLASAALGTCYPLVLDSLSTDVPEPARGTALGVFNVCFYLAGAVISAVTGLLLQASGESLPLLTIAAVPLLGAVASTVKAQR